MSGFTVIPAVDIRYGRAVRLVRGLPSRETVFADDPVEAALRWQAAGAALLHVVDLDGAFAGAPANFEAVERVLDATSIPVQVGGGIRSLEVANRYLDAGAARVIMGTAAFQGEEGPDELARALGDRLAVGVDVKGGRVALSGWAGTSGLEPLEAVDALEKAGVARIVYTDVSRDGTLEGPNMEGIVGIARSTSMAVIASGGVGTLDQIRRLADLRGAGVEGVIIGMALYRGEFALEEAMEAAAEGVSG
ncbi:MAG: 1-(5-phosphoribosyl)-5-[(5-phosphoribosylamino)methylideneamino]imidazole-4-carboxamide isomerase [Actinobacteria bacterium]|nr:1-(5-phosphoribosyl)-5-[(5-phosphoribosylamino)methylideneamino]imidazole-4-carboxamide isomerase [Actinomycetota bacterium]MBU1944655.1 1-(5-phosphoribosyl)-5-[(5-phosphoribosylamino)methylideneamino]imidazole-4-carboxamide isomerase [Actinomycetota bacterium]MBU2689203.1 1-(5-phosphoribosyl)-5-[(5-phosphoribosylamino)methylideneamino]imidazole-4-carboxamide isomerase [Actinomycetota bacterium]